MPESSDIVTGGGLNFLAVQKLFEEVVGALCEMMTCPKSGNNGGQHAGRAGRGNKKRPDL